jgi:hypothetical protein
MSNASVNSDVSVLVGGWSPYESLSPEDKLVFDEATQGFVGVKYTPQTVSEQVVAGMNYRFRCVASMPPAQVVWEAIVEIFKPLNGKPYVVGIIRL